MDREKLIKAIDDGITQLSHSDLVSIAHIIDPNVDSKFKIDKKEGLYIKYDAISNDVLQRIDEFIRGKLKS